MYLIDKCFIAYSAIEVVFPGGSVVKNMPPKQEMQVQSLDREDPLEKKWHSLRYSCLGNPLDRGA